MTVMEFRDEMSRMNGLRFAPAGLDTHWEALRDMPLPVLSEAIGLAVRTRAEYPTPVELRQDADQVKHRVVLIDPLPEQAHDVETKEVLLLNDSSEMARTLRLKVAKEWRYYCEVCNDNGTRSYWCGGSKRQPWIPDAECESRKCRQIRGGHEGYGHEWVQQCQCHDVNPAVQRRLAEQRTYAERKGKAS